MAVIGQWRLRLAMALLLVFALAIVVVSPGTDRGLPYRGWEHDVVSDNHLAVATNLSPEHGFLQFHRWYLDADAEPAYVPYSRFPLLGYVLIRLAVLPVGEDLSGRLHAARLLMLAFFAGAAALAYASLRRLTGRRAAALAATSLAFSSYPLLYLSDMIATEGVVDLFAVMLAFHGLAVYVRPSGRVRVADNPGGEGPPPIGQLLVKTCAALLLGWHVYGLLVPLLLLAVPHAIRVRDWRWLRHCVLLGAAAALIGLALLAFNFAREHHALDGGTPFLDLPSVRSLLNRAGVAPERDFIGWGALLLDQLRRIGEGTLPWVVAEPLQGHLYGRWHWVGGACVGLVALLICLPGTRHRGAWGALALCGMAWALLMRHSVQQHEYEALFHVGVALTAGALLLARLQGSAVRWRGRGDHVVAVAIVAPALALFVASAWTMGRVGDDAETRRRDRVLLADLSEIRRHTAGKVLHVPRAGLERNPCCRVSYLAGRAWTREPTPHADFVVDADLPRAGPNRSPAAVLPARESLTPDNRVVFLYEPSAYRAALTAARATYERLLRTSEPAIASDFAVHHVGDALLYVGEGGACDAFGPAAKFFLHVYAADLRDLPAPRRREGFANLNVARDRHWGRDGRCFALAFLPTFAIGAIHTGQFAASSAGGGSRLWEGRFSPRPWDGSRPPEEVAASQRRSYQRIAADEPLARAAWDVFLLGGQEGDLAFLKTPCAAGDTAARFFVHVVPADVDVLPAARRRLRFDNWDFDFRERGGTLFNDRCVVYTRLPGYDIDTVRAGQYDPSAGVVWTVEFPLPRTGAQT